MKDYTMVVAATKTAQELLKDYSKEVAITNITKSANILEQIGSYIYQCLVNIDFHPDIRCIHGVTCDQYKGYTGEARLTKGMGTNGGETWLYTLAINRKSNTVFMRFNKNGYWIESYSDTDTTIPTLFIAWEWKNFKAKFERAIDNWYKTENKRIEEEAKKIKCEQAALDNFEI